MNFLLSNQQQKTQQKIKIEEQKLHRSWMVSENWKHIMRLGSMGNDLPINTIEQDLDSESYTWITDVPLC